MAVNVSVQSDLIALQATLADAQAKLASARKSHLLGGGQNGESDFATSFAALATDLNVAVAQCTTAQSDNV